MDDPQPRNATELPTVVGDERAFQMQTAGRNQEIVGIDDPPLFFQTGPELGVAVSGRGGNVHNLNRGQALLQRLPALRGMRGLLAPEEQFRITYCRKAEASLRVRLSSLDRLDGPAADDLDYLPMQNRPKISPRISSVSAEPTIRPTLSRAARRSMAGSSGGSPARTKAAAE